MILSFIFKRPISVSVSIVCLLVISSLAFDNLPVSLLPTKDIPKIVISTSIPNFSPEEIENNVLAPIRETMRKVGGMKSFESIADNEVGRVRLTFDYGTNMKLAYIEVNERIDQLAPFFPKAVERPTVIQASTSDLPIIKIQITPSRDDEFISASELCIKVLKRRLEQIEGVGIVDLNGIRHSTIRVTPNYEVLKNLHLSLDDVTSVFQEANLELGSLSVKDGNYRYYMKLGSKAKDVNDLGNLLVHLPNKQDFLKLKQIATIVMESEKSVGLHLYNNRPAIVVNVHRQANAKLTELMPRLNEIVEEFKRDYPRIGFDLTQDQSQLLTLSLSNLRQSVFLGSLFAFGVLFLFMRGWKEPLIMGIVIPLSLVFSFSILYAFDVSINIISLSGLIMGLGMLVDNSIVVIDNIIQRRQNGFRLFESCVEGTRQVSVPLFSSAITNLIVFVPLIFVNGLTGALFLEQAISVACILFISLLCTFIVVPMLYLCLFKKGNTEYTASQDSRFYLLLYNAYLKSFQFVWIHKKLTLFLFTLVLIAGVICIVKLPRNSFPNIAKKETLVSIDWNESIDATENSDRIRSLLAKSSLDFEKWEADVGFQQFLLADRNQSISHVEAYLMFKSNDYKDFADRKLKSVMKNLFPLASMKLEEAPNAFVQMFSSDAHYFEARFRKQTSNSQIDLEEANMLLDSLRSGYKLIPGKGFETETMVFVHLKKENLLNYNVSHQEVIKQLTIAFKGLQIAEFSSIGESIPINLNNYPTNNYYETINEIEVVSRDGVSIPINNFVTFEFRENYKVITSDNAGTYQSVSSDENIINSRFLDRLSELAKKFSVKVQFTGRWLEREENLRQILIIFILAVFLMFCVLAAEFESVTLPLLVLASIPIAISGSLIVLWLSGGSINVMSGIGVIVVLGIVDNDAILKIDRINSLRSTLPLEFAIKQAGKDRFKAIVMNTCTNVLGILPICFASGIGADLQKPIVITTIGGLIMATLTALYFIPILYWMFMRETSAVIR